MRNPFRARPTPLWQGERESISIALVGSSGVGKSSILHALNNRSFIPSKTKREIDIFSVITKFANMGDKSWALNFSDQACSIDDPWRTYAYSIYDIFIVCYTAGDAPSYLEAVNRWIPEIRSLRDDNPPIILLSTKVDSVRNSFHIGTDQTWQDAESWRMTLAMMKWQHRLYRIRHPRLLLSRADPIKPPPNGTSLLMALPDEIMYLILSYLHTPDIMRLAMTCQHFRLLTRDLLLWEDRCRLNPAARHFKGTVWSYYALSSVTRTGFRDLPKRIISMVMLAERRREKKSQRHTVTSVERELTRMRALDI